MWQVVDIDVFPIRITGIGIESTLAHAFPSLTQCKATCCVPFLLLSGSDTFQGSQRLPESVNIKSLQKVVVCCGFCGTFHKYLSPSKSGTNHSPFYRLCYMSQNGSLEHLSHLHQGTRDISSPTKLLQLWISHKTKCVLSSVNLLSSIICLTIAS